MIKKIGVENFRVFKDYTEFEIRPITLLVGPNNSGKSSFTKLLRLIKNGFDYLNFSKGDHSLKDFGNVLNNKSTSKELKISTVCNIPYLGPNCMVHYTYKYGHCFKTEIYYDEYFLYSKYIQIEKLDDSRISSGFPEVRISLENIIRIIYNKHLYIRNEKFCGYLIDLPKKSFFKATNKTIDFSDITLNALREQKSYIKNNHEIDEVYLLWQSISNEIDLLDRDYIIFDVYSKNKKITNLFKKEILAAQNSTNKLPKNTLGFTNIESYLTEVKQKIIDELIETIPDIEIRPTILGDILFKIKFNSKSILDCFFNLSIDHEEFKNLKYLSPSKLNNRRVSEKNSHFDFDKLIYNHNNILNSNDHFDKDIILTFIKKSLKTLNIKGDLQINTYEDYISTIKLVVNNSALDLADLGFGYKQALSLILFMIDDYESYPFGLKPISVIEEPEANLHPNLQSKLADVFNLYYKSLDKRKRSDFIIETHSEYLIRKFQYLVAEGELKTEDIIIYYFNDDSYVSKDEPKVKPIEIEKNGNLSDTFGPGFYDEAIKLQFKLLKINQDQHN